MGMEGMYVVEWIEEGAWKRATFDLFSCDDTLAYVTSYVGYLRRASSCRCVLVSKRWTTDGWVTVEEERVTI